VIKHDHSNKHRILIKITWALRVAGVIHEQESNMTLYVKENGLLRIDLRENGNGRVKD